MTYDEVTSREKTVARVFTACMHIAFLVLLVFGVSWQKRVSEPAAVVDLWRSLPPVHEEPPEPPPAPPPRVEKPAPKPPPAPPPKPEAKPAPKPDIALREKLEKERKLKQQREHEKQRELEKRKEDEAKKLKAQQQAELRKKEEEKRKVEKERLAQEAEAKKLATEKQAIAEKLAKEQAAGQKRVYDQYVNQIQNKIKRNIVEPPNLQGNPRVEFELRLLPGGEVLEPTLKLKRSSGNPAYDQAVERAILKSSPLPLPPDPTLFDLFRDLHLSIRPKE